jgi:outer membrane lipoprotein SlyB
MDNMKGNMSFSGRAAALCAAFVLAAALPACAPQQTGSTVTASGLGRAASVSYGTIVGMRPVQVAGRAPGGVGTVAGAAAGGIAGSFIGGDWRSNALAGIGGALAGGLAGSAIEGGISSGTAIEFIVREDQGGDIAVVQTNEDALQVGDRVFLSRGDRVRIARAAGQPVQPGFQPQMAPQGTVQGAPIGHSPGPVKR